MTVTNEMRIRKIKKLLALSKSNNSHEAAIAMNQAIKLMKKFNINNDDIEQSKIKEHTTKSAPSNATKPPSYFTTLIHIISNAFGVHAYLTWIMNKRKVTFYGCRERPQIAAYAFDVLSGQLVNARKNFISKLNGNCKRITKINRADAFCLGWVNGVQQLVEKFALNEREEKLLIDYINRKTLISVNGREPKKGNSTDSSMLQGFIQGKNAKLNHAVTGASKVQNALTHKTVLSDYV